jgi:hypothetical protein
MKVGEVGGNQSTQDSRATFLSFFFTLFFFWGVLSDHFPLDLFELS